MNNLLYDLFYISLLAILFSCNPKESTHTKAECPSHSYSNSYKAPVFTHDDRIEKIKKIAPEIQKLTVHHAIAENIPGIAYGIVVDNELVIATANGYIDLDREIPATPSSSFRIASMTKSFTAMAILKLRDEGKLALSDAVCKYIPEMSNVEYLTKDAPTIDIENLLTMTAGFPEDNPWGDRQLDEPEQMLIELIGKGISFSNVPSYEFEYSNTGFALLGNIVSHVSGVPFEEYITQYILRPLRMEDTYWEYDSIPERQLALGYRWEDEQWKLEPMLHDGSYGAMGGLITSIEDFSKYVSFLLSAWPPRSDEDTGPVKRSSLREMQTPQFSKLDANALDSDGDTCSIIYGYGYGLRVLEECNGLKLVFHNGALPGFGSNYVLFPEYGIGIMAFCNLTYTTPWPVQDIGKLLFETADLKPRKLPVPDILLERQEQIIQLIQNWETDLEAKILAENFYLDKSRDKRMTEVLAVLEKAGPFQETGELKPENQLRGSFKIYADNGNINIFFTLTPEKQPKVQQLDISYQPR